MTAIRTFLTRLFTHPLFILAAIAALFIGSAYLANGTVAILGFLMLNIMLAQAEHDRGWVISLGAGFWHERLSVKTVPARSLRPPRWAR
jgi:hypothetical protein